MEKKMQDLELATSLIEQLFTKNPSRSVSGALKFIKRQQRFFVFGDYPILSLILRTLQTLGISITHDQVVYAFRTSSDFSFLTFKEKKEIRQSLLEYLYVQENSGTDRPKKVERGQTDE